MAVAIPIIGEWYQKTNGSLFEIVAIDDEDGTIEIQYFDGTIAEVDLEAWHQAQYQSAEAPEDYSGSLDIEPEDCTEIERASKAEWADPLDYLDQTE